MADASEVRGMRRILISVLAMLMLLLTVASASATLDGEVVGHFFADGQDLVKVTVRLKNIGGGVERGLVEVQLRRQGAPFAFIPGQGVCDPDHPENVAQEYLLQPGEETTTSIIVRDVPELDYDVYVVNYDRCCTDGTQSFSCSAKEPFGSGLFVGTADFNTFGDNDMVECSWDSQCAGKVAENCLDYQCRSNACECDEYDGCVPGAVQRASCGDGTNPIVRECNSAGEWVSTDASCADPGDNPPPPPDVGGPRTGTVLAFTLVGAGIGGLGFLGGPVLGSATTALGALFGFVVGVMV